MVNFCFYCITVPHTRVAAEGQFPSGRMGLSDAEVPVFVDPHGGGVRVPAGVGKQEVLKAREHLRGRTDRNKAELDLTVYLAFLCQQKNDWNLCQCKFD